MGDQEQISTLPVPAYAVGSIIGAGGKNINWISRNARCNVWVDDEISSKTLGHEWCHVKFKGTANERYTAVRMVIATILRCEAPAAE